MTEEEARLFALTPIRRARFLFDAAHNRYGMLDVTKVACLMSDRIEELERNAHEARERAIAAEREIEQFVARVQSKGIIP